MITTVHDTKFEQEPVISTTAAEACELAECFRDIKREAEISTLRVVAGMAVTGLSTVIGSARETTQVAIESKQSEATLWVKTPPARRSPEAAFAGILSTGFSLVASATAGVMKVREALGATK